MNNIIDDIKRAKKIFETSRGLLPNIILITLGMARKIAPQADWLSSFEHYPDNTVLKISNNEVTVYGEN